jgi:hypothetical protein
MSTINIFHSSLDDTHETFVIAESKTIQESFPDIDFTNAIISVNGFQQDKNYILKDDDICAIRLFPDGDARDWASGAVLGLMAGLAVLNFWNPGGWVAGAIVVGAGISVGALGFGIASATGNSFVDYMMSMGQDAGKANSPDSIINIPQLRGAKNQSNYNKPIPIVLGKHFYTPMYIGMPYTEIAGVDGEDQYFNALFLLGYSKLQVTDIKLGVLGDLCSNKGPNARDDGILFFDGNPDYQGVTLELRQSPNEVGLYPQKVVEESLGIELIHTKAIPKTDTPEYTLKVDRFTAKNPIKVQIEFTFGGGLITYNKSGEKEDASVSIIILWRKNENDPWHDFGQIGLGQSGISYLSGVSTITKQKSKVMRFMAEHNFDFPDVRDALDHTIELHIERVNTQADDTRTSDKVHLTAIRTWCCNYTDSEDAFQLVPQVPMIQKYRDKTCRLGFRIKATGALQGTLDSLNCIVQSYARVWNGRVRIFV